MPQLPQSYSNVRQVANFVYDKETPETTEGNVVENIGRFRLNLHKKEEVGVGKAVRTKLIKGGG